MMHLDVVRSRKRSKSLAMQAGQSISVNLTTEGLLTVCGHVMGEFTLSRSIMDVDQFFI